MRICIVLLGMLFSEAIYGQTQSAAVPAVNKSSSFVSFTIDLAEGALVFTKSLTKNSSGTLDVSYSITQKTYNNGKAVAVQLNRQSFDTYFKTTPALFAAYNRMVQYAQDKNISFTEENGWAELIRNYNNSVSP